MKRTGYIVIGYAAIVLMGGLMGCFIANSIPSLVAGLTFGGLITFNGVKILRGNVRGITLALIQSIIIGSFFIYRYKTTGNMMPAAPMVLLSFGIATYLLFVHPKEAPKLDPKNKN